jgi:hypothetical protein
LKSAAQYHRAHFHAYYQSEAAVFAVDTIECLGGGLPKAQLRLVEAWADSPVVALVTQSGIGNTQHREPRVAHLRADQPAGGSLPVRAGAEWGARGLTSDCARRGVGDPAIRERWAG